MPRHESDSQTNRPADELRRAAASVAIHSTRLTEAVGVLEAGLPRAPKRSLSPLTFADIRHARDQLDRLLAVEPAKPEPEGEATG